MLKNSQCNSIIKCPRCNANTCSICESDGNCYTKCVNCGWKIMKYAGVGVEKIKTAQQVP
jgi:primosomal protein N'